MLVLYILLPISLVLLPYWTRRRKIGGWLFLYYMQLYLSIPWTFGLFVETAGEFIPSKWPRTDLYVWYLLGTVPPLAAFLANVSVATYLLVRKSEVNLRRTRLAIAALLGTAVISLAINLATVHRHVELAENFLSPIWLVYLIYFYKSSRVTRVFVDHNWVYVEPPSSVKTPRERSYLRKRALLWAAALYAFGFIVGWLNAGMHKPNAEILFELPVVYAVLAGLISYACPIRKRKRDALRGAETPGDEANDHSMSRPH